MKKAILTFLVFWLNICILSANYLPSHNILVLHSYHPSLAWNIEINKGLVDELTTALEDSKILTEYMDSKRIFDEPYQQSLVELYKHKFRDSEFDLIIVSDDDALNFMQRFGEFLFPGVPLVFCGINVWQPDRFRHLPHYTGVLEKVDAAKTLDMALELFPKTKHVYFIGDKSTTAYDLTQYFRENHQASYPKIDIHFFHSNILSETLDSIASFPDKSIVLLWPFVGHHGNMIVGMDALPRAISEKYPDIPLFGLWDFMMGHGIIGGKLVSGYMQGKYAAMLALEILQGTPAEEIPVMLESPNQLSFDYRKLKQHGISTRQLPENSIISYAPLSFSERYQLWIYASYIALVITFIVLLVTWMLNRKIRNILRRELVFQQALMDSLPNAVFYTFDNATLAGCNKTFEKLTGKSKDEMLGKNLPGIYLPNQIEMHKSINHEVGLTHKPATFEGQILGNNNRIRDVLFYKSVIFDRKTKKFGVIETIVDITEKKLANEKIRISEERYALATRATRDGIWDLDIKNSIFYTSERLKEILGYSSQESPINFHNFDKFIYSLDFNLYSHQVDLIKRGEKESFNIEIRMKHKAGDFRWVEVNGFGVTDKNRNIYRLVASISDIHERKASELLLKRWEDIFKNTRMGVAIGNPGTGTIDLANPIFAHMHGFTVDEITGKSINDIFAPEERHKIRYAQEKAHEEGHYVFESVHLKKNGTAFPVMIDITAVNDATGKPLYRIVNVQDITDRKKQESIIAQMLHTEQSMNEELRSSEEELKQMLEQTVKLNEKIQQNELRFRTLLENSYDLITLVNADGIITYCSDAAERITGYRASAITGKPIGTFIPAEDRQMFRQKMLQIYKSTDTPTEINHRLNHQDGTEKHLKSIAVNHLSNPLIEGILITSRDVSLEVQSEELRKNIILAQKSAEIKQQFLANMSHEIRTPMNGIIGMLEFLIKTPLNEDQRDYVDTIKISADSLLNIINDILDFSKIEAGKLKISPTLVNVHKLANEAHKLFAALTKQKNLEFIISADETVPEHVLLDPVRINQIISNLLSNAIKFTPGGRVSLHIHLQEEMEDGRIVLRFEVHDSGIGISEANQEKLFSAFSQIDSSFTRTQEGTGLGLAISRNIVKLMGGHIGVTSKLGEGSVFWFTVCTQKADPDYQKDEIVTDLTSSGPAELNLDVLLVEDKKINQKVISLMLNSMGCRVNIANNGQEAVDMVEAKIQQTPDKAFDVIFMDIQMPVMDGISATRIIREKFPQQKIIIGLSANVLPGDIEFFLKNGLNDYIVKPTRSEHIYRKLLYWTQHNNAKIITPHTAEMKEYLSQVAQVNEEVLGMIKTQSGNNELVIKELLTDFQKDAEECLEQTREANVVEQVVTPLEKLKNAALYMGAIQVARTCDAMEVNFGNVEITEHVREERIFLASFLEKAVFDFLEKAENYLLP